MCASDIDTESAVSAGEIGGVGICRNYLQQVVTIHCAMFERLLKDDHHPLPLELAELFEDAANTYLNFSDAISAAYCAARQAALLRSCPETPLVVPKN